LQNFLDDFNEANDILHVFKGDNESTTDGESEEMIRLSERGIMILVSFAEVTEDGELSDVMGRTTFHESNSI
jgi:hypothetical protein